MTLPSYEWLRNIVQGEQAEANLAKVRQLAAVAADLGCTQAQLAIAWCLKNPHVSSVITGASRPEQVVENMAAAEVVSLIDAQVDTRLEEILGNRPTPEPNMRDW
jgi:aryl-alcohol dehydrogenase-like predicted oxidoreductase